MSGILEFIRALLSMQEFPIRQFLNGPAFAAVPIFLLVASVGFPRRARKAG